MFDGSRNQIKGRSLRESEYWGTHRECNVDEQEYLLRGADAAVAAHGAGGGCRAQGAGLGARGYGLGRRARLQSVTAHITREGADDGLGADGRSQSRLVRH